MAILEAHDIVKRFRIPSARRSTVREHVLGAFRPSQTEDLVVLDGVSFEVQAGETLGIMGRNGSGKSTLLKILSGIYAPDNGRVVVRGAVTPILELGVGWNPELDAIDNILLLGSVMGMGLGDLRRATDEILAFAELERFANLKLQHYSSGMASRLAYSVAFKAVREILILDEIFAVGDAGFRDKCLRRYADLKAQGHTVVSVSHDPEFINEHCDRALLIEGGRLLVAGDPFMVSNTYSRLPSTSDGTHDGRGAAKGVVVAPGRPAAVAVVVPFRDSASHLTALLDALVEQSARVSWELVAVDNGSSDGSVQLLRTYSDRLRLRVVNATQRASPAFARNAGARTTQAEKLLFIDADDAVSPHYVRAMADALERNTLVVARVDALALNASWVRGVHGAPWPGLALAFDFRPSAGVNIGIHRRLFESLGGFRESLGRAEDVALSWDAQAAGHSLHFVEDAVYFYRYRHSLRSLYLQTHTWGVSSTLLFRHYRERGMPGRSLRLAARDWLTSIHAFVSIRSRSDAGAAVVQFGYCTGRLLGSMSNRVAYL